MKIWEECKMKASKHPINVWRMWSSNFDGLLASLAPAHFVAFILSPKQILFVPPLIRLFHLHVFVLPQKNDTKKAGIKMGFFGWKTKIRLLRGVDANRLGDRKIIIIFILKDSLLLSFLAKKCHYFLLNLFPEMRQRDFVTTKTQITKMKLEEIP